MWTLAVSGVKPMPGKKAVTPAGEPGYTQPVRVTYGDKIAAKYKSGEHLEKKESGPGIDKRTDERLRRGEMEIDARLDLHGLDQDKARDALEKFIVGAHRAEKRCVLVITGTGKRGVRDGDEEEWFMPQKGVLKQKVPEWLAGEKLRHLIVKTHPAQRKHGGEGAMYVLIRRRREKG